MTTRSAKPPKANPASVLRNGGNVLDRCLSLDLEVGRADERIHALAGVRPDTGQTVVIPRVGDNLAQALARLDELANGADFLLGHNLIAFDLPHLWAANPRLRLLDLPAVDTLRLNPLAFPRNPYHHLVKHYQDGSLIRGRRNDPELDALLDSDTAVAGVTQGALRQELAAVAVPTTVDGGNMAGDDFAVSVGWGHSGSGDVVMPGQGRVEQRDYTAVKRAALGDAVLTLDDTTLDVYLNERAYWCNVPAAVWNYPLGGYQVLKKWLSYRERKVLGRSLQLEEVQHCANTARRIGAIIQLVDGGRGLASSGYTL